MKKSMGKRLISGVTSAVLAAVYMVPSGLSPGKVGEKAMLKSSADEGDLPSPKYGGAYTVENILSEFQYFVQEDFTVANHTVGALAVGGVATLPDAGFGQGAVTQSYFKTLNNAAVYGFADYYKESDIYETLKDKGDIYYNTYLGDGDPKHTNSAYTQITGDYIDFDTAFEQISNWSNAKKTAPGAWIISNEDLRTEEKWSEGGTYEEYILDIDIKSGAVPQNIIITDEIYHKINFINFILEENGKPDYGSLASSGITFTFSGVSDASVCFGGWTGSEQIVMKANGKDFSTTAFQTIDHDASNTFEGNIDLGIDLVWNFPDAETVSSTYLAGHIVAPNAHFEQKGSNAEGNVIARSADGGKAQAHFYSFKSHTRLSSGYSLDLFKYDGDGAYLAGALLGAFPSENGTVGTTASRKLTSSGEGADSLHLKTGRYVIREIAPPDGYAETDKEYYIEIIEQGHYLWTEMPMGYGLAERDIEYSENTLVKVYKDSNFTEVVEEAEYSGLAIAQNTYTIDENIYTFGVDDAGNITIYKNGTDVTDAEKDDFTFNQVKGQKNYELRYNGEKLYQDKDGHYRSGDDYFTVEVDDAGNITSVQKNGEETSSNGFEAVLIPVVYTVLYNGRSITPENGLYTIEGSRYSIVLDENGNVAEAVKIGEELDPDDFYFQSFGFGAANLYNINDPFAPLTSNTDGTYNYNGKKIEVKSHTENGGWFMPTSTIVDSVKYVDEPAPASIVDVIRAADANYIVVYDGKVVDADLNLSDKLATKFEFTNTRAFTAKKVDEKGRDLKGSKIALIQESYTVSGDTLTLEGSLPADGAPVTSVDFWDWDDNIGTFNGDQIRSVTNNGGVLQNVYRIIETAAPEGYVISDEDIIIIKYRSVDGNASFYTRTVPHGTAVTDVPIDFTAGRAKDDLGGWEKIDESTAEGRTFNIVNKRENINLSIVKVDESGAKVEGAVLEVYKEGSDEVYETVTSNKTSAVELTKTYEPGVYYIVETKVPYGFKEDLKDVKQYFTVKDDLTAVVGKSGGTSSGGFIPAGEGGIEPNGESVMQYSLSGSQIFGTETGKLIGIDVYTNTEAGGANFNCGPVTPVEGETEDTENGKITHYTYGEGITAEELNGSQYQVKIWTEASRITGMAFIFEGSEPEDEEAEDYAITIENGSTVTISFPNESKPGANSVSFSKITDELGSLAVTDNSYTARSTGARLAGAKMTLTLDGTGLGSGVTSNLDEAADAEHGKPEYSDSSITWYTLADSDTTFSNLPNGKYTLTEEAPEGYQPIRSTSFTLDNGRFTKGSGADENIEFSDKNGEDNAKVTVTDTVFSFAVRKVRPKDAAEEPYVQQDDIPVYGALLELASDDAKALSGVAVRDSQIYTGNGEGRNNDSSAYLIKENNITVTREGTSAIRWYSVGSAVVFTGLPEGSYTIREIEAPLGYTPADDIRFEVVRDEEGFLKAAGNGVGTDANGFYQATLVNEKKTISISKSDLGGVIVDGAEFKLSAAKGTLGDIVIDNGEDLSSTYELTSGAGSTSRERGIVIKGLEAGLTYKIRGSSFNNVTIDGAAAYADAVQNNYEYSGTASGDTLTIGGLNDGIYIVEVNGLEYTINPYYGSTDGSISQVTVQKKAELTNGGQSVVFRGGSVNITGLKNGEYLLTETVAPNGYTKVETTFSFKVTDGKVELLGAETDSAVVTDDEKGLVILDAVSEITVNKYFDTAGNRTPKGTETGAELALTFVEADTDKAPVTISGADTLAVGETFTWNTKDANPKVFKGLMDGKYELSEVQPPEGYEPGIPKTFVIRDGVIVTDDGSAETEVSLMNTKEKKIVITKKAIDGSGEDVALDSTDKNQTAQFTIFGDDLTGVVVTDNNGTKTITANDLDEEGGYTFTGNDSTIEGLKKGSYTLREIIAPEGFTVVSEFTFEVDENGELTGTAPATTTGSVEYGEDGNIIITDDISVISLDKRTLGGEPLAEGNAATFTLRSIKADNLLGVKIGDIIIDADTEGYADNSYTFTSNNETFIGLKDGDYILTEVAAPDGYQKVTTEFKFTVENGVIVSSETATTGDSTIKAGESGSEIIATDDISTIELSKEAFGSKPLADGNNATFTLKGDKLEGVTVNGRTVKAEDIKNGGFTFTSNDAVFKGLKDGEYELTEVAAPDGFQRVTTSFRFVIEDGLIVSSETATDGNSEIKADESGSRIIATDDILTVNINKRVIDGSGNEAELDNTDEAQQATFTIKGEDLEGVLVNGKAIKAEDIRNGGYTFTGNETTFEGLKNGSYTLVEEVAPDGFTVVSEFGFTISNGEVTLGDTATTGDAEIDENGNIVITDKISTISVSKEALGSKPLAEDNQATFTLTMTEDADGNDDTAPTLEGVVIRPVNGSKTTIGSSDSYTFTSNDAVFEGLKDGTYTLVEVAAPDGYRRVETTFEFVVENGVIVSSTTATTGNSSIRVDNGSNNIIATDDISTVKIDKKVIDATGKTAELDSTDESQIAKFTIKGTDLTGVVVNGETITSGNKTSYSFDGNETTFEGLKDGVYTLVEEVAPDGFTVVSEFKFEIRDGETVVTDVPTTTGSVEIREDGTIVILDDISTIEISKEAFGSKPLADGNNATFTLKGEKLEGVTVNGRTVKAEDIKNGGFTFTSNDAVFKGLKDGRYELTEDAAPAGFQRVTTTFKFEIENGVIKEGAETVTTGNSSILARDGKTIVATDDISTVQINKKAIDGSGEEITLDSTDETQVAEFTIKGEDLTGVLVNGEAITGDNKTSYTFKSNSTNFEGLKDGKYTLIEETAPDGFTVVSEFEFTISDGRASLDAASTTGDAEIDNNGNIIITDKISTVKINKKAIDGSGNDVELDNTDKAQQATFTIKGDKLEGVKVNGKAVKAGDIKDGGYTFTGNETTFEGLKDGKYTLIEEAAPDGFTVVSSFGFEIENGRVIVGEASTDGEVVIDENGNITITDKISVITVNKFREDGKTALEGAVFEIRTDENDEKTAVKKLQNSASFTVEGLGDGTYFLVETKAPEGYAKASAVKFTVENGVITDADITENTINVTDTPLGALSIMKKGSGSGLAGATLTLTGKNGSDDVEFGEGSVVGDEDVNVMNGKGKVLTWVSGAGAVQVKNIPNGVYTLTETKAPKGYLIADPITFEVKDGKLIKLNGEAFDGEAELIEMTDAATNVKIKKLDSESKAMIDGAKLEIRDETDKIVSVDGEELRWTSSSTEAWDISKLEVGKTYRLVETEAPAGYIAPADAVLREFVIGEDGKIADVTDNTIEVTNKISRIKISKFDDDGETLLPATKNAKLTLTMVSAKAETKPDYMPEDAVWIGGSVSWNTSEENPKVIKGLLDGEYVLSEDEVPEGYVKAEDILITIVNGKVTSAEAADEDVRMVNHTTTSTTTTTTSTTTITTTTTASTTTSATTSTTPSTTTSTISTTTSAPTTTTIITTTSTTSTTIATTSTTPFTTTTTTPSVTTTTIITSTTATITETTTTVEETTTTIDVMGDDVTNTTTTEVIDVDGGSATRTTTTTTDVPETTTTTTDDDIDVEGGSVTLTTTTTTDPVQTTTAAPKIDAPSTGAGGVSASAAIMAFAAFAAFAARSRKREDGEE